MAGGELLPPVKLRRIDDWPRRLADFIEERRGLPFMWGCNDCCLFAADAIERMTGVDLAADFRGYGSAYEAAEILKRSGGTVWWLATALLGLPIDPHIAQRGDVVGAMVNDHHALAICLGDTYAAPGEMSLAFRPMPDAMTAWKV